MQFRNPAWMTVEELSQGALRLSNEEDGVMALVFRTYTFERTENPDLFYGTILDSASYAEGYEPF